MDIDPRLHHPFNMIISGSTQAGKSELTAQILQRKNEIIYPRIYRVEYCFGEAQPRIFAKLQATVPNITFCKGLPTVFGDELQRPTLYILDDLMDESVKSKDVQDLFTRGTHHRNLSVILLTQNFYHKNMRTLTLNAKYICVFKNPRDNTFICTLGSQMNNRRKNLLMEDAFAQSTKHPYGYLFIDCAQNQNDWFRLRDRIFPDDLCTFFVDKDCPNKLRDELICKSTLAKKSGEHREIQPDTACTSRWDQELFRTSTPSEGSSLTQVSPQDKNTYDEKSSYAPIITDSISKLAHVKHQIKGGLKTQKFACSVLGCLTTFTRSDNLLRHLRTKH